MMAEQEKVEKEAIKKGRVKLTTDQEQCDDQ